MIKKILRVLFSLAVFAAGSVSVCAENNEAAVTTAEQVVERVFTEQDKMIFGIFPIWMFIASLAGICMLIVIILVIIGRKKHSGK